MALGAVQNRASPVGAAKLRAEQCADTGKKPGGRGSRGGGRGGGRVGGGSIGFGGGGDDIGLKLLFLFLY